MAKSFNRVLRRRLFVVIAAAAAAASAGSLSSVFEKPALADTQCPWMDTSSTPAKRAATLLQAMTLDQKLHMVHDEVSPGESRGVGTVTAIPELCVPPLYMTDGGQGIATTQAYTNPDNALGATAVPAPIAQAATFDPAAAQELGRELARQAIAKGDNVLLGPDVNAGRVPGFYRNWEGIGGEDPYLQGSMASAFIKGAQSRPVVSVVKHYAAYDGGSGNAIVDDRTLHETYEKPFENAVRAGAGSVMCAYEKVNGQYSCENGSMLTALKKGMNFSGWVMSDWGAVHSTVPSVKAGLDQEMDALPARYYGDPLKAAVQSGEVSMAELDGMVYRILVTMFTRGLFDNPPGETQQFVNTPYSDALAMRMSQEGTVMLKNDATSGTPALPLTLRKGKIAVIGIPASPAGALIYQQVTSHPDSKVIPSSVSAPLDAITSRAQQNGDVVVYDAGSDHVTAAAVASAADVAIVFVYTEDSTTLQDRNTYTLPDNQDAMVEAVAKANPNTSVVINSGGPVSMPWLGSVRAVLEAWYPGQQDGNAIAGILLGDAEPGGRLPQTFPVTYSDEPAPTDEHSEGLYTGYRWFEHKGIAPLFPFGYGLTYTTFKYGGFSAPTSATGTTPVQVSLTVTNTGSRSGSDVPQVYVGWPRNASMQEPVRQLRGFQRVELGPGVSQQVTIALDQRSFSYWDTKRERWTVQAGCYPIWMGRDAASMVLTRKVAVGGGSC